MKKILSYDSPIVQFLSHITDFFILNILTVICSIPIFTIGAALTAHGRMMQNILLDDEQPIIKSYFHAFACNFKQATVVWLFTLLLMVLYAADVILIYFYLNGAWAKILYFVLIVLGTMTTGVICYVFTLIGRYENTLKEHIHNSVLLAIGYLPRTLLVAALAGVPLILWFISIELFLNAIYIWLICGISVIVFLQCRVLKPVILSLEPERAEDEEES